MELKTLKEIHITTDGCNCEQKIRQEAIKWIKDIQEGTSFEAIPLSQKEFTSDVTVNCFKCFFNITDEDLE